MVDLTSLAFGFMLGIGVAATWHAVSAADEYKDSSRLHDMLNVAEGRVQDLEQRLNTAVETAFRLGSAAAKSWARKNYPHWTDEWTAKK